MLPGEMRITTVAGTKPYMGMGPPSRQNHWEQSFFIPVDTMYWRSSHLQGLAAKDDQSLSDFTWRASDFSGLRWTSGISF